MSASELPVVFDCVGESLVGVLHQGLPTAEFGVLIVVGGPQYRVGSHREFVVLARRLAAQGTPVLRFDVRGMGDASGDRRHFEEIEADVRAAVDTFLAQSPLLSRVVLMGLCDGASSSLLYATRDPRVSGLVLMNPWIRSDDGLSRYPLRHYYWPRLLQKSLWYKALRGDFRVGTALREFAGALLGAVTRRGGRNGKRRDSAPDFVAHMRRNVERFEGQVLFLISGNDLVGREFLENSRINKAWRESMDRDTVTLKVFPDANHTMTARRDLDEVADECLSWLSKTQQSS